MKDIKLTIIINRPAHEVFNFIIGPENTPKWIDGIIKEQVNEAPTKLGTIYKNQSQDGSWRAFEVTGYRSGAMFEMTEKDSNHHVQFTLKPLNNQQCELEYHAWIDSGDLDEPFTQDNLQSLLQKLKAVMEAAKQ